MNTTWITASACLILLWAFGFVRSKRFARTTDRWEIAVLTPLSMSYYVAAVAFLVEGHWGLAICSVVASLLTSGVGATMHPKLSGNQLAQGMEQFMEQGPGTSELSHDESYGIASAFLSVSGILAVVVATALVAYGFKWYIGIPLGAIAAYVGTMLMTGCVIYRPKAPTV